MRSPRIFLGQVALAAGLIVTAGCSSSSDTTNSSNNATDGSTAERTVLAPAPPAPTALLSEQACQDYCDRVIEAVHAGNPRECSDLMATDIILDRSMKGLEISSGAERGFRQGFHEAMKETGGLFGQVAQQIDQGTASYVVVRLKMEGRPTAIFRLLHDSGLLNYHQIPLVRCPDGKVRGSDFIPATTGESGSQTLRRMTLQLAANENRSLLDRLTGKEKAMVRNIEALSEMGQAVQGGGNPRQGIRVYKTLPPELQQDKTFLILYLLAATAAGSMDEYLEGFETLKAHYPSDPSISLLGIDYYFARKEFDEALECTLALDDFAGEDAYIHTLRGNIHLQAGDLGAAQREAPSRDRTRRRPPSGTFPRRRDRTGTQGFRGRPFSADDDRPKVLTRMGRLSDFPGLCRIRRVAPARSMARISTSA